MEQYVDAGKTQPKKSIWLFGMVIAVFLIIQFDAAASVISNQILSMGSTLVVWGAGAAVIWIKLKKKNLESALYSSVAFSHAEAMVLFFAIARGAAMALGNFLYAGLKPLFVRELLTGYPLYNIRNIIYYPLEVLLMLELLICSQKAGGGFYQRSPSVGSVCAVFAVGITAYLVAWACGWHCICMQGVYLCGPLLCFGEKGSNELYQYADIMVSVKTRVTSAK